MTDPWLTIVTPVRDNEAGLHRTMASITMQELDGVEVLVVDSSRDRDTVASVCSDIAEVMWMEPQGVYPAMNAGLARATGTYVQFLGAGDALHDPSVLSRVRHVADGGASWMFGPVRIINVDGSSPVTPRWNYTDERKALFARGLFPQHQGTFAQLELLRELGGFSPRFRIAADYEMFLRLSHVAAPMELDFIVADFSAGGLSTDQWQESFHEFHQARKQVFRPTGLAAAREQWDYRAHFARVWAYREVVEPLRRRARR